MNELKYKAWLQKMHELVESSNEGKGMGKGKEMSIVALNAYFCNLKKYDKILMLVTVIVENI